LDSGFATNAATKISGSSSMLSFAIANIASHDD